MSKADSGTLESAATEQEGMRPEPVIPRPGQESVWDYPRPPRVEACSKRIRVVFNGITVADTRAALRVLETSQAPVYYLPPTDVRRVHLVGEERLTLCEWKGLASYFTIKVGDRVAVQAAWSYPDPTRDYEMLRGYFAFYPGHVDACYVDHEQARSMPGDFYGGWITDDVVGPFKGGPGTERW
jgi:uncharacterized protein (DUF427 family)